MYLRLYEGIYFARVERYELSQVRARRLRHVRGNKMTFGARTDSEAGDFCSFNEIFQAKSVRTRENITDRRIVACMFND